MELGNLTNVTYGANTILSAINTTAEDSSSNDTLDDKSAASIKNLLRGETAETNQNKSYAIESVSLVQEMKETLARIQKNHEKMAELATQAADEQYSTEEVAQFQREFGQIAEESSEIIAAMKFNGNELFGDQGQAISISIGNGSTIDIAAEDLTIDIEDLD